ncbi:MAG: radical SAM protein [Candidatus Omnitrophota bacterium]
MEPVYLEPYKKGVLQKISAEAFGMLESCSICPRRCGVNRLKDEKGFCKTGLKAKVFSFMPHRGEEPAVSGQSGSGTIFFSHCNMACAYCQNYEFSQEGQGREVENAELADFMLELKRLGCHNINLVTPTHVMPQILKALNIAAGKGLDLPIVYNSGGYELPEIIKLLEAVVDIYLVDMRYAEGEEALKYSSSPGYPRYNQDSVKLMHKQVGVAKIDPHGIMARGLIIRHLVLPNNIAGTAKIMEFIAKELSSETYISLMSQYLPYYKACKDERIARRITQDEYARSQEVMHEYGLYNGWVQDSYGLERFAGVNIKPFLGR